MDAWLLNPDTVTAGALLLATLALRLATGHAIRLTLTRREKAAGVIVLALAFLADWGYLIVQGR